MTLETVQSAKRSSVTTPRSAVRTSGSDEPPRGARLLFNMKTFKSEWDISLTDSGGETATDLKLRTNPLGTHVEKVYDEELRGFCYELAGPNVNIRMPKAARRPGPTPAFAAGNGLELRAPYLALVLKDLGLGFMFEVNVKDAQSVVRRIRFSSMPNQRVRNSQFGHTVILDPLSRGEWRCYVLDMVRLMRSCFGQDFRELQSVTLMSTMRVKAVLSLSESPTEIPTTQMLASMAMSHWPPHGGEFEYVVLPSVRHHSRSDESTIGSSSSSLAGMTPSLHTKLWERAVDFAEPPLPKGMDTQSEEMWTPSLDAVVEEDVAKNTADTEDGEVLGGVKAIALKEAVGCRTAL